MRQTRNAIDAQPRLPFSHRNAPRRCAEEAWTGPLRRAPEAPEWQSQFVLADAKSNNINDLVSAILTTSVLRHQRRSCVASHAATDIPLERTGVPHSEHDPLLRRFGPWRSVHGPSPAIWLILVAHVMLSEAKPQAPYTMTLRRPRRGVGMDRRAGITLARTLACRHMLRRERPAGLELHRSQRKHRHPWRPRAYAPGGETWKQEQADIIRFDWFSVRVPTTARCGRSVGRARRVRSRDEAFRDARMGFRIQQRLAAGHLRREGPRRQLLRMADRGDRLVFVGTQD